jgi:hypothetical protein
MTHPAIDSLLSKFDAMDSNADSVYFSKLVHRYLADAAPEIRALIAENKKLLDEQSYYEKELREADKENAEQAQQIEELKADNVELLKLVGSKVAIQGITDFVKDTMKEQRK